MGIAHQLASVAGRALRNLHAGTDRLAARKLCSLTAPTLQVHSPQFGSGQALPHSCTHDGGDVPPMLQWNGMPREAQSVVVLCEDPDAPFPEPFVHWLQYDIPASARGSDPSLGRWGKNSLLKLGYTGAAPPPQHGTHHYHFQVFALELPKLQGEALGRSALLSQMRGHIVGWGELVGTYARS